jgi:vacuolar-type H+-ATPase subunit H
MTPGTDPVPEGALVQVKRKEIELQSLLLEARREAEDVVAKARDEAAKLRVEARTAAEIEARELHAAELEESRREADEILRAFEERASALGRDDGVIRDLATRIARAVAPRPT